MSRTGNAPVSIPDGVDLKIEGRKVLAKGKLGEMSVDLVDEVDAEIEDGALRVRQVGDNRFARNMWGTTRALIQNIVTGVSEGFTRELEIQGVGYRAAVQGKELVLNLGLSHDVRYPIPDGVTITCEKPTSVKIHGTDKQVVGQIAAEIRAWRPPEPYKGKGIRFAGEYLLRKEGKKK